MKQPCLDCGTPTDLTRCPSCKTTFQPRKRKDNRAYNRGGYRKAAAIVRATATLCHICKQGTKPDDPWQADHLLPVKQGGGVGGLAAAHRSCNIARANRLRTNPQAKPEPSTRRRTGGTTT